MDRLICGDVGFGKTELSLRAAFLSVSSGYQVIILVPTTLLARQHFESFNDRFRKFSVNIDCLSRFDSKMRRNEILENTQNGKTDIIIGTHALLSDDIKFKNLGLIVIDEEQNFWCQTERISQEALSKGTRIINVCNSNTTKFTAFSPWNT